MVESNKTQKRVLLLGEGNFSYALARVKLFEKEKSTCKLEMIATSFDSGTDLI